MKEKVLYDKLPEEPKHRETLVTVIPKPEPLIGGSPVFQIAGVPYWYCTIKNSRDLFMHLYMEDLTEKDLLYDSKTGRKRIFDTSKKREYKENVMKALANKPKEGYRWISAHEPSFAPGGGVQFVKGEEPLVNISCEEWGIILRQYSPINESDELSKNTYFLLSLRWLKDGIATLDEMVEHSEEIGHYSDSKNAKKDFEKAGERQFGGLFSFVGNTCILVKDSSWRTKHGIAGGSFWNIGKLCPMANITSVNNMKHKYKNATGWAELKK